MRAQALRPSQFAWLTGPPSSAATPPAARLAELELREAERMSDAEAGGGADASGSSSRCDAADASDDEEEEESEEAGDGSDAMSEGACSDAVTEAEEWAAFEGPLRGTDILSDWWLSWVPPGVRALLRADLRRRDLHDEPLPALLAAFPEDLDAAAYAQARAHTHSALRRGARHAARPQRTQRLPLIVT